MKPKITRWAHESAKTISVQGNKSKSHVQRLRAVRSKSEGVRSSGPAPKKLQGERVVQNHAARKRADVRNRQMPPAVLLLPQAGHRLAAPADASPPNRSKARPQRRRKAASGLVRLVRAKSRRGRGSALKLGPHGPIDQAGVRERPHRLRKELESRRGGSRQVPAPVRRLPRVQDDPAERLFGYKYVVETLSVARAMEVALTVLSSAQVEARAVCQVYRLPFVKDLENTSCDPRLGYANDRVPCATCHATDDCPGHWGFVSLPVPFYNPVFFHKVLKILNSYCCPRCAKYSSSELDACATCGFPPCGTTKKKPPLLHLQQSRSRVQGSIPNAPRSTTRESAPSRCSACSPLRSPFSPPCRLRSCSSKVPFP